MINFLLAAVIVVAALLYVLYERMKPGKLKPMFIGVDTVKHDDQVIVRQQPVVVNVVYDLGEHAQSEQLADLVINYKDLMSGKYLMGSMQSSGGDDDKDDQKQPPETYEEENEEVSPETQVEYPQENEDEGETESEADAEQTLAPAAEMVDTEKHNFNF